MSERTEKLPRSDRPTVTPNPTDPKLFDWVEDKFNGPGAFPRYFELRIAFGPGGAQYRAETLHQKEFKENIAKPGRAEMVEIANKFFALAQDHCNEIGRPQGYNILAINHMKGSAPYGVYYRKLRPTMFASQDGSPHGGGFGAGGGGGASTEDDEIHTHGLAAANAVQSHKLLDQSLEHQRSNDEHFRFMYDGVLKSTATLLQTQQEMIREQRSENQILRSMEMEWRKAMNAAADTTQDREIKAAMNKVKIEVVERAADLAMQLIPVVAKSLEGKKDSKPGDPVTASLESIAINQFVDGLTNDQKIALFGYIDHDTKEHVPGIFTLPQVSIFGDVAKLKQPISALEALLPEGAHSISMDQITLAKQSVAMEKLMPLYAMIVEGQKKRAPATTEQTQQGAP